MRFRPGLVVAALAILLVGASETRGQNITVTNDLVFGEVFPGIPKTIKMTSHEVREALQEPLSMIIEAIRLTLERTPPELAADIVNSGIYLAGGGFQLKGIDTLIREETNLPVTIAEEPHKSVVIGAGRILEDMSQYEKVIFQMKRE